MMDENDFYEDDDPPEVIAEMWRRFHAGEIDGYTETPRSGIHTIYVEWPSGVVIKDCYFDAP